MNTDEKEIKPLDFAAIMRADDRPTEDIEMPEWNGHVRIKAMTANDLIKFQQASKTGASPAEILILGVVLSVVDERGMPVFDDRSAKELKKKSVKPFMRLQEHILRLNGLDKDSRERLEAELKNV